MKNKSKSKARSSNSWGEDIDRAMKQIEKPVSTTKATFTNSYSIPPSLLYVAIVVLVVLLVHRAPSYETPHPIAENRDMGAGPRVAMLMVAQDIEQYRSENGQLPKEIPSALGNVLDIKYKRIGKYKFELHMYSKEGKLVLKDNSSSISVI